MGKSETPSHFLREISGPMSLHVYKMILSENRKPILNNLTPQPPCSLEPPKAPKINHSEYPKCFQIDFDFFSKIHEI